MRLSCPISFDVIIPSWNRHLTSCPHVGKGSGLARWQESRTPVDTEKQLHGGNGEGMGCPFFYPLAKLGTILSA